jgi:hypothetical protein
MANSTRRGITGLPPLLTIAVLRSKASRSTLLSRRRPPFLSLLSGPVSLVCLLTACGGSPTHPTPPASSGGPPAPTVQAAVSQAYQREFGLSIPSPAIFNDPRSQNCLGAGHLTTTAYLRTGSRTALLHFLYMSRDAGAVIRRDPPSSVVAPAGTFRALVVVTQHPETVGVDSLMLLEAGQRQINEDHAAFARAKGFPGPIVSFESTNVTVAPSEIADPRSRAAVLAAAGHEGLRSSGYDFIVSLNIDPMRSEGGFATPGDGFVYVGNYAVWRTTLGSNDWMRIAATAYHHEVAHHWGWPATHDWSPSCSGTDLAFRPLIAAPVLFGWEDVDGDGIPEILDETPYGRSR